MSKRKHKSAAAATCVFCGNKRVTHEHIWEKWVDQAVPRGWDRAEQAYGLYDDTGKRQPDIPRKIKQGAVHTKTVRKVCSKCNGGWMRDIGNTAKPYALKLMKGEIITLGSKEQTAIATWVARSALVASLNMKSIHKMPPSDLAYMHEHHLPPPNWFIWIGFYIGPEQTALNFSPFPFGPVDPESGRFVAKVVLHSTAMILGSLYVLLHSFSRFGDPNMPLPRGVEPTMYAPYLIRIWPLTFDRIPYPPRAISFITGSFNPGDGLAFSLKKRLANRLIEQMRRIGFTPRP